MPAPYSLDLRKKVINRLVNGERRKDIAAMFCIGTATIQRWWTRYQTADSIKPKEGYQNGHSHKIKDLNEFRDFAENNRSLTSSEMALKLGDISRAGVCRYLKKIDFTRKKILTYTKKKMMPNEKNF